MGDGFCGLMAYQQYTAGALTVPTPSVHLGAGLLLSDLRDVLNITGKERKKKKNHNLKLNTTLSSQRTLWNQL